jgi:FAD/FMN-containing dehydrogenase
MPNKKILKNLRAIVGSKNVRLSNEDLATFGIDRTIIWTAAPSVIVLPGCVTEVQRIVSLANEYKLAIVPSGGRTGLSGGAVAKDGEIVVAMDRINQISDFNAVDRTVSVGAGVITQKLQEFAAERGLYYPVDFSSSGSSQIGGNIATNAGGINVIRYGMTRQWIVGITAVNGRGEILHLNQGLVKNNTGYDFRHLFIGSEGTLGLICDATIRLTRPKGDPTVIVLGINSFSKILEVLKVFTSAIDLTAFEFFSQVALDKVINCRAHNAPFKTKTPFYVLLEFESIEQSVLETGLRLFDECLDKGWVLDGVMSQSSSQANALWKLREDISETLWQYEPYKNDISVLISRMPDFIEAVETIIDQYYPNFEIVWYGHIGDGNLHLNILKPASLTSNQFIEKCSNVSKVLGKLIAEYKGSISAEHGVGLLKKDVLHYSRSEAEIDLMREIKKVFDPNGILNPGKLIE